MIMANTDLTDQVKSRALAMGADLVGVASADRYQEAPRRLSPEGILPGAKCVVVIAIHHPDAAVELGGERNGQNDPHYLGPYNVQGTMNTRLECISFELARFLEDQGNRVVAIPATNVWRFHPYKEIQQSFTPDLSNIHAAVAAGLGEIGFSGLLLTPEFGPRQRLCCLVTDADLEPTPLYDGPPLCDRCMLCRKWCLNDTFTKEVAGEVVLHIGEKEVRYCDKNKWRCAWSEHFALDLNLPKPEVVDEEVILDNLAQYGWYAGAMGSCLRFCLPPHLRLEDPDNCRPYRRKRPFMDMRPLAERNGDPRPPVPNRPATENICRLAFEGNADLVGVALQEDFEPLGIKIRDYLPDGNSVLVFAIHFPASLQEPNSPGEDARPVELMGSVLRDWLGFLQLDLCRYLESLGYSAVPGTEIDLGKAIIAAGLGKINDQGWGETEEFGTRQEWACLATSAYLEKTKRVHPVAVEPVDDGSLMTLALKDFLRDKGAVLVGIAASGLVDQMISQWREAINEEELKVNVVDTGGTHGPFVPEIRPDEDARIRFVGDHLESARSVVVIGYHYPYLNLERAAEEPAEAVGPYAYATYQVNRKLRYMAVEAARRLERWGYQVAVTTDLSSSGSVVANPRGPQPDALANRFATVAAGLGYIGWHGAVITPQFGVTQRFIALITDAPLIPDSPVGGPSPCEECNKPCVATCPVAALAPQESIEITTQDATYRLARWDRLRCEWTKKYALVGDEGPKWIGQTLNIMPPAGEIAADQIAEALKQRDPIQKHWTCILEGCLKACQLHLAEEEQCRAERTAPKR